MNKYRNQPTVVDGRRFASRAEAKRYRELQLLEKAGEIRGLRCQVRYDLPVNGCLCGWYVADFVYEERRVLPREERRDIMSLVPVPGGGRQLRHAVYEAATAWSPVVEDVKGHRTDVYKLKKKLMRAIHYIEIREVQA